VSRSKTGKAGKVDPEHDVVQRPRLAAIVAEASSIEVEPSVAIGANNGHGLGGHQKSAKLAPLKSVVPQLDRKQTCADALSEICRLVVQQILHNWGVVQGSDDPEGPHQMRIGLRRLRSALKCFRPIIDNESLREINERARSLGRILSELRDADVLATDIIDAVLANHDDNADLQVLKATLEEVRTGHRRSVRDELESEDWSAFRLELSALPELVKSVTQDEGRSGRKRRLGKYASRALEKRWRGVTKAGRRLSKLTIEERHQLRKDLKTFRYSAELLTSLYRAKDVRRFSRKLRRLQDRFGYLNDLVVAQKLKAIEPNGTTDALQLQRAVGYVLGWHTAHADDAWLDIKREWRMLERAPLFWQS
jgi:CHAD domain-containing protein